MLGGLHPDSSRSSALGHSAGDALAMKGIMTTARGSRESASRDSKKERPEQRAAGSRRANTSEGIGSSQMAVDPKAADRAERTRVRYAARTMPW